MILLTSEAEQDYRGVYLWGREPSSDITVEKLTHLSYVETLENRLETMERLLNKASASLLPPGPVSPVYQVTSHADLNKPSLNSDSKLVDEDISLKLGSIPITNFAILPQMNTDDLEITLEDDEYLSIARSTGPSNVVDDRVENRKFIGKSSGFFLIRDVRDMKSNLKGVVEEDEVPSCAPRDLGRPEFSTHPLVSLYRLTSGAE